MDIRMVCSFIYFHTSSILIIVLSEESKKCESLELFTFIHAMERLTVSSMHQPNRLCLSL